MTSKISNPEYALYKGDNLLMIGTIQEIADYRKVKRNTITFLATRVYKERVASRKNPRNYLTLTKLD